jgi:putative peptidoglycan lipid II flippase
MLGQKGELAIVPAISTRMTENRAIARAAGLVSGLTFVSRLGGLVRDAVTAYLFGGTMAADAFFVAFRLPNLLRRFVAEGAMTSAFVPVFSEYLTQRSRAEAAEAERAVATAYTSAIAVLTVLGMIYAPELTRLFAPGFGADPGKLELTAELTRWTFPYIFFVSLVALIAGMLNAMRHFAAPALAPLSFNLGLILAAVALVRVIEPPIYALAYGVIFGGIVQVLVQIPALRACGISLRPLWQPAHEAIRRVLFLMAPTVFGAAVYHINVMVSTILASMLPSGSPSYLWYSDRVFEFPLGVFAVALGTAALPSFSAQAARRAYGEMGESLLFALRLTSFITVPASIGIYVLAGPITSVLFQRGAFGYVETQLTARAIEAACLGLWAVSMQRVVVPAYYAMQDTRTPVITASVAFLANLFFALMFMGPVVPSGTSVVENWIAAGSASLGVHDLRHAGLALATSLAAAVNLSLLALLLRRRLPHVRLTPLLGSLGRDLAAAAVMAVPAALVAGAVDWAHASFVWRAAALGAAIALGAGTYAAMSWLLGSPEVITLAQRLRRR